MSLKYADDQPVTFRSAASRLLTVIAGLCFAVSAPAQSWLIENVAIYDVASGELTASRDVAIVDGSIVAIAATGNLPQVTESTTYDRIDGSGLTLLPGLIDAHVHITKNDFGALLANGITAVRELNGSPDHLALRDAIRSGDVFGPRLLVSSPLISGRRIDFRHVVFEPQQPVEARIAEFAAADYDYLKIYDDLENDVYERIVTAARKFDLALVGHVPRAVGLQGVLAAGQSIEHNEKIVVDALGFEFSDLQALNAVAAQIAEAGVAVTPTLAVHELLSDRRNPEAQRRLASDDMRYVADDILAWWRFTFPEASGAGAENNNGRAFMAAQRALLRLLHERNVPLLAGTDTPNPLMVAGFSLHDELEALTRGGLSNADAIRAATLTPGRALNWPVRIGEVKTGFAADLLLVRGNPAEDLSVLRQPYGLFVNGVWQDAEKLSALLHTSRRR